MILKKRRGKGKRKRRAGCIYNGLSAYYNPSTGVENYQRSEVISIFEKLTRANH